MYILTQISPVISDFEKNIAVFFSKLRNIFTQQTAAFLLTFGCLFLSAQFNDLNAQFTKVAQNLSGATITTITPNTSFKYHIQINCASLTVTCGSAVFSDILPTTVSYIGNSATSSGLTASYNAATRKVTVSGMNDGSTYDFDIIVGSGNLPNGTVINNTATITDGSKTTTTPLSKVTIAGGFDPTSFQNNVDGWKSAPPQAAPNGIISYSIGITNPSGSNFTNYRVEDIFPANFLFEGMSTPAWANTNLPYSVQYRNAAGAWVNWFSGNTGVAQWKGYSDIPGFALGDVKGIRFTFPNMTGGGVFVNMQNQLYIKGRVKPNAALGSTITNCAIFTATNGSANYLKQFCDDTKVQTVVHPIMTGKVRNPNLAGYLSGDIVPFTLYFGNSENASEAFVKPEVIDILPPELEFVDVVSIGDESGSFYSSSTSTSVAATFTQTAISGGRTRLKWAFSNMTIPIGWNVLKIVFRTKVKAGVATGNYTNYQYVNSPTYSATHCYQYNPWAEPATIVDATDDIDGDGNKTEAFCSSSNPFTVIFPSGAGLETFKWVKGTLDADYNRYPLSGATVRGGISDYKLIIKNPGTVPMTKITVIDILPFVGDKGVVVSGTNRLSQWQPYLVNQITAPAGVTTYYSTATNPCRPELGLTVAGCVAPNWTITPPTDMTTVRSLKFDLGNITIKPGDSIVMAWPMRAPANAPVGGEIAWNSFGYVATRTDNNVVLLASEPRKVGISVVKESLAIYGDKVWLDANANGIQDPTETTGVSGVKVELFKDNGDGIPNASDTFIGFTMTGSDGSYLFPNLIAGNYYAVFSNIPSGFTVSPPNVRNNSLETTDSDGSLLGIGQWVTSIKNLAANEEDRSWDLGIFANIVCPTTTSAGDSKTQCNPVFTTNAPTPSVGTGTWIVVSGAATILDVNSPVTTVTVTTSPAVLRWSVSAGVCATVTSDVTFKIAAPLAISIYAPSSSVCVGSNTIVSANVAGGADVLIFKWEQSTDNVNWTVVAGQTESNFAVPTGVQGTIFYRATVTSSDVNCGSATTSIAKVVVAQSAGCDCVLQDCSAYTKLVYKNPIVITDAPNGLVGDKWRFNNVATGFDAIVEITKAVNANNLGTIDNAGVNVDDWCPEIGLNLLAGQDSYVDWKITVVAAGTDNPANLPTSSRVTSYDVDGNTSYREIHGHINSNGYILNNPTELSILNEGQFAMVIGSNIEHTSISTHPEVKATFYYPGQNNVFTIRLGVRTAVDAGSATRQFAVSFDPCVSYTNPDVTPQLPEIAGTNPACVGGQNPTYTTTQPFTSYNWEVTGGTIVSGQGTRTITVDWTSTGNKIVKLSTIDANGCAGANTYKAVVTEDPSVSVTNNGALVCKNSLVVLNANVTGGNGAKTFQWQSSTNGVNWADISGATNATFIAPTNAIGIIQYRINVNFTNSTCSTATSAISTVEVVDGILITAQPTAFIECLNESNTLSVTATGGKMLTYQWFKSTDNSTWTAISGETNPTYTPLSTTVGKTYFKVTISSTGNDCGAITTTPTVVEIVNKPTIFITAPSNEAICQGNSVILTANVTNGSGTPIFQWQQNIAGTWTDVGGNTPSFTTSILTADADFRVSVTQTGGACGNVSDEFKVKVVVTPSVNIAANGGLETICAGGSTILTANVTGGSGTTNFQWQQKMAGTWTNVGSNVSTFATAALTENTDFKVIVTQTGGGCNATSSDFKVNVVADPSVLVAATNATICKGNATTLNAAVSNGFGTTTYQWQQKMGGIWTNVGDNNPSFTTPSLKASTDFQVIISQSGNGCGTATSALAAINVLDNSAPNITKSNLIVCVDGKVLLTADGTATSSYQWQSSKDETVWQNIDGATGVNFVAPTNVAGITFYKIVGSASGFGCSESKSGSTSVEVVTDPSIATQPEDITECVSGTRTLTVFATGGNSLQYQWQQSTDNATWTDISLATATAYQPPSANLGKMFYRVQVTSANLGCDAINSAVASVNIVSKPIVNVTVAPPTICFGGTTTLNATINDPSASCTLQWQSKTGTGTWDDIPGQTGATFTTPALNGTTKYRAALNCSGSGCCN